MTETQSMHPLFNSWMRAATLWTDRQTMDFRSNAINQIAEEETLLKNGANQLSLIKMVFCNCFESIEWFQKVFAEFDDQFPLDPSHNNNELKVLAAIALAIAVEDESKDGIILSSKIVTASLMSKRQLSIPSVPLVDHATGAISSAALLSRQPKPLEKLQPTKAPWNNPEEEINKLSGGLENGRTFLTALSTLVIGLRADILKGVVRQNQQSATITNLQEEVDLLWWVFSGYSEICDQKFSKVPKSSLPILLGIEISQKISQIVEPPSLYALVTRVLEKSNQGIQLTDALINIDNRLFEYTKKSCPVITPISYAIKCIEEDSEQWKQKWEKATGLSVGMQFNDRDLAIQCCREQLVLQNVE